MTAPWHSHHLCLSFVLPPSNHTILLGLSVCCILCARWLVLAPLWKQLLSIAALRVHYLRPKSSGFIILCLVMVFWVHLSVLALKPGCLYSPPALLRCLTDRLASLPHR